MEKRTTVEARNNFSDLMNEVAFGKGRIILTRRGRDLVAVIPIEDLHLLEDHKIAMGPSARRTPPPRRVKKPSTK
jgi:prevent-host-death family protein